MVDLSNLVLWTELKTKFFRDEKLIESFDRKHVSKIGNFLYLDKNAITDPILSLEANLCTDLTNLYPISLIANEFVMKSSHRASIMSSKNLVDLYGISMIRIPDEILNANVIKEGTVVNFLDVDDCDKDYTLVVRLTSKIRIGRYTL